MAKIRRIKVGFNLSAVLSEGQFENIRPFFVTERELDLDENEDAKTVEMEVRKEIMDEVLGCFEQLKNRCKADLIESQVTGIRFYPKNGFKLPSVTSIIGWDKKWAITEIELIQHGAQGTLREAICVHWMKKKVWIADAETLGKLYPELHEEILIATKGKLQLPIFGTSYKIMMEKYNDKIEVIKFQETIYNIEHKYAGTLDLIGRYEGKLAIIDFKKGAFNYEQLAAYAKGDRFEKEKPEKLVILHIGDTDNKIGYERPSVSEGINLYFDRFLLKRILFKKRFGV